MGTILFSDDAGESWRPQFSGTGNRLNGVFFLNPTTGWVVGQGELILRTATGGAPEGEMPRGPQATQTGLQGD
jgi:photosystem II stability/assembly factor-like uncharacterized protein